MEDSLLPRPLRRGDLVALLAPASAVSPEYCDGAVRWLERNGFRVRRYPSAGGISGSYSAPEQTRIAELRDALSDPEVKAILCARGGYGCAHLLEHIDSLAKENPKWIIGFSDVSALHALMQSHGYISLHSSMAKHLTLHPEDAVSQAILKTLLTGRQQEISCPADPLSIPGKAHGILIGGNLAVINALAESPWSPFNKERRRDCILFIEDISEAIYAVERMLFRLHISGFLDRVKGIIVGQFTEYRPDRNFSRMDDMISYRLRQWGFGSDAKAGIPVAFNFPAGHVDLNLPLLLGSPALLCVTPETQSLRPVNPTV